MSRKDYLYSHCISSSNINDILQKNENVDDKNAMIINDVQSMIFDKSYGIQNF